MSEHLSRETLEGFLRSAIPAREVKATVAHLLGGCGSCQGDMEPLATAMFRPDSAPEPRLSPEEDAAYENAISAAFAVALDRERGFSLDREMAERKAEDFLSALRRGEVPTLPEAPTLALCEALFEKSWSLRYTDREATLRLANLARLAADRLDPVFYGADRRTDLQAKSWAELANAYRISDDLPQAEAAVTCALELRRQGSGDALLYARISDIAAAVFCSLRRFAEAFRMLDTSQAIYRRHGDVHEAGRVLIMKGLYAGYAGNPEQGLQLLVQGLSTIDRSRDAKLVFHTLHNILLLRVELGEFEEAHRQLRRMRPLYAGQANWLDLVKLRRIEGQIAAGLGDLDRAAEVFLTARHDLDQAGLGYHAALISLDLAAVRLRQSRTAEVRELIAELVATFRALGVEREAMAAVLMLKDAQERDQATLDVLQRVGGILRRLQNEPASRAGLDTL
jgi:tetratricopeptide (TPR) repeat protein